MMPAGRPTKYNKGILEKVKKYFQEWEPFDELPVEKQDKEGNVVTTMTRVPNGLPTALRIADYLGIARSTVFEWMDKYPELSDAIKKSVENCFRTGMYENGLTGDWTVAMTIFLGKNLLGMSDRQETKISGELKLGFAETLKKKWDEPGS